MFVREILYVLKKIVISLSLHGLRDMGYAKCAPNSAKLCKSGPCSPRGQHTKDWVKMAPLGCGSTPVAPTPLIECLRPIFGKVVPSMLLMTVQVGFPQNIPYKLTVGCFPCGVETFFKDTLPLQQYPLIFPSFIKVGPLLI